MQFAQSATASVPEYDASPSTCPQSVVTGPAFGIRGVRWMRPPDFLRTDSSRTIAFSAVWASRER
jgi:hypothetical protein